MPDTRQHRGPHPQDAVAFAPAMWPRLQAACRDLSWLLSHGYADRSAGALVGDRYALTERQRVAVRRCACATEELQGRQAREVAATDLAGVTLQADGYNVLITIEAALSGGVLLLGREGCWRDMASMHGNYRRVAETPRALALLGETLTRLRVESVQWYLDAPVSYSARLAQMMEALAAERGWPWQVELVPDPDPLLAGSREIVATADRVILDAGPRWFNLAREVVQTQVPEVQPVPVASAVEGE